MHRSSSLWSFHISNESFVSITREKRNVMSAMHSLWKWIEVTDVSPDTSPAVWCLQYIQLFFYLISTQYPLLCPSVCFHSGYCHPQNNLHPFSNVENVQMFLIVIIKAKRWLCKAGSRVDFFWLMRTMCVSPGRQSKFILLPLKYNSNCLTERIKKTINTVDAQLHKDRILQNG